jgi:hypothetical protein
LQTLQKEIIYQYKNKNYEELEPSQDESDNNVEREKEGFSLIDLLQMSQNDISKMIFSFDKQTGKSHFDFTEMKKALRNVENLQGIDDENLPAFRYFQIKKCSNYQME